MKFQQRLALQSVLPHKSRQNHKKQSCENCKYLVGCFGIFRQFFSVQLYLFTYLNWVLTHWFLLRIVRIFDVLVDAFEGFAVFPTLFWPPLKAFEALHNGFPIYQYFHINCNQMHEMLNLIKMAAKFTQYNIAWPDFVHHVCFKINGIHN